MAETLSFDDTKGLKRPVVLNSERAAQDAESLDNPIEVELKEEPPEEENPEAEGGLDALLENHPEVKKIRELEEQLRAELVQIDAQILETRGRTFGRGKAEQQREALMARKDELEEQHDAVMSSIEAIVQSILNETPPAAQEQVQEQQHVGAQAAEIMSELNQRRAERDALPETDTQGRSAYDQEITRLQGELEEKQSTEQIQPGTASPESGEATIETSKTLSQAQDILRHIDNLKLQRDITFNLAFKPAQKLMINEAIKTRIQETERKLAELYPELKSQGLLESLTAKDRAYLAEISGDKEMAEKAKTEVAKGSREKERGELHKDVQALVDRLSTESFDAFKGSRLEKKYGRGVFGKIANFLSQERDFNYGPDGPTRKANWEVLMRAGGRVLTDKKVLWSAGIAAVLAGFTGGLGAAAAGVATSQIVLGTAAGRGLAEAWARIRGEEGGAHEDLLRAEFQHYLEMQELARQLNYREYSNNEERNALVKQLIDTYHEVDSGEVTRIMKDRQRLLGETTEKWDKVRNKWTNVGALAGAGVGIMQNWQALKEIAHRVDLGGATPGSGPDGIRHAIQRIGGGYQHIYGHAFADQYGTLHAAVPHQTIGPAGVIGHRLLESNQQIYWAMTKSVAPTLLKSAAVLAGALLPRIRTHHIPTEFELRGGDLDRREMYQRAGLEAPGPPPPTGGETPPETPPDGPDSGGPTPTEAAAAVETTTVELEKLKETLEEEYGLIPGKYIQFKDELTDKSDKEKWVQKDVRYRFAKMNKRGGLVFEEEVGDDEVHEHVLGAERFMQLRDDERIALLRKKGEPVKEPEAKSKEEKEEKPAAKPDEEAEKKIEEPTKKVETETGELPERLDNLGKIRIAGELFLLSNEEVTPEHLRDRILPILERMKEKNSGKKGLVAPIEEDIKTVNAWIAKKEEAVKKK